MGLSFHTYPSVAQYVDGPPTPYSRATPLACDTLEWDTTGCFDTVNHCFTATAAMIVRFNAVVLFQTPAVGQQCNVWFMKNVLPPPDGSIGGEICGDDVTVFQPSSAFNVTARISRLIKLNAGDRVWCVPGCNGGGQLTNAVAGNGYYTCNYFEGEIIG